MSDRSICGEAGRSPPPARAGASTRCCSGGTFPRIRDGKDLRSSWDHAARAAGSHVEVLFADKGEGRTGVTLNHTRIQSRRDADELRAGWSSALDVPKKLVECT